jgi:hypothetical protein
MKSFYRDDVPNNKRKPKKKTNSQNEIKEIQPNKTNKKKEKEIKGGFQTFNINDEYKEIEEMNKNLLRN